MFGIYEVFPENYHGVVRLSYDCSTRELQKTIIHSLYLLNTGRYRKDLKFAEPSLGEMEAILEFGIADGLTFNYIDEETLKRCWEELSEHIFSILDFLCIVRYYVMGEGKKKPLRFDYYILRLLFYGKEVEFQVFHEKGTQRLSVYGLITIITEKINKELTKRKRGSLKINYLHVL